ncbi:P-loop containing nucleoside triphosphate hydrolase protein [Rutstroemia sp. NJR-2017a BVV2]|nr:P-loop containing nucleoside triphosphate hydrolase protein [Rutstroemia sp. NJR-2017a BVV2]
MPKCNPFSMPINGVPSTSLSDPWLIAKERFVRDLDPAERKLFDEATPENMYYKSSNIQRADAENSKARKVLHLLQPLVVTIEDYGKAMDTFSNVAPLSLGPIWGCIRVVLVLASNYGRFYDAIIHTLARIGDILPSLRQYQNIFDPSKHPHFEQKLSAAYLEVIEQCMRFRKLLLGQKTSLFKRVMQPLSPSLKSDLEQAVDKVRERRKAVEEEAHICHMVEAKETQELVLRNVQLSRAKAKETKQMRLISQLSNINYQYKHRRMEKIRHRGTGDWITDMDQYRSWVSCDTSCLMSFYGIPGSGKSVSASSLIDWLQSTVCGVKQNVALAYYYCDYADKRTLTSAGVFSCIAQQLLRQKGVLSKRLMGILETMFPNEAASASLDDIVTLLTVVIDEFKSVILFVDGTDELPESDRNTTFQNLRKVVEVTASPIKLFVSGRADISYLFPQSEKLAVVKVSIRKDSITSDINSYLRHSISELIQSGDLVIGNPSLEEDIFSALSAGAQGMFLWAKFQLDELCQLETDAAITKALRNLPRNLEDTFDRLLQRVLGDETRELVKRMFNWIVFARRPLHMNELREAIAFTINDGFWDAAKIPNDLKRLVRACGNLVIVDEETENVQLAHHTDANREIGEVCVAYLCFSDFELQVTRPDMITPTMAVLQQAINTQSVIPYSSTRVRQVVAVASAMMAPRKIDQRVATGINFARHISRKRPRTQEFYGSYRLLAYLKEHWLWHVESFTEETRETKAGRLFKRLLFEKQFSFSHTPWDGFSLGDRLLRCAMLGWAISTGHLPLLRELVAAEKGVAFEYVGRASHKFWKLHLAKLDATVPLIKMPEKVWSCYFNLDNMTSENDCLEWLYFLIVTAAQNGNFPVIELCLKHGFSGSSSIASFVRAHLLLEASLHRQFEFCRLLPKLSHNVWLSYEGDETYATALDIAMYCGETRLVFSYLEDGCPSSYWTSTMLFRAKVLTRAARTESESLVNALLQGLLLEETPVDPVDDYMPSKLAQEPSPHLDSDDALPVLATQHERMNDKSLYQEISENEELTNIVVAVAERGMVNGLKTLLEFTASLDCTHLYRLLVRHIAFLAALTYDFPEMIAAILSFDMRLESLDCTGGYMWYSVPLSQPAIAIMKIDASYAYSTPIEYLSSDDKQIKLSKRASKIILSKIVSAFKGRIRQGDIPKGLGKCSWKFWDVVMGQREGAVFFPSLKRLEYAYCLATGDWKSTPVSGLIDLKSWPCLPVPDFGERTEISWLLWAVLYKRLDVVEHLLQLGARGRTWAIESTYGFNSGEMSLLCAIIAGSYDMIKLLVDAGVPTSIRWRNKNSHKPKDMLDLVVRCQPEHLQPKIVDLIVSRDHAYWAKMITKTTPSKGSSR